MSASQSPQPPEKLKRPRRQHKNSKLGCLQCKERRMKCNEELPACRNCLIRQVKIPCSYLSFTEDEKKEFLKKKAQNEHSSGYKSNIISPVTPSSSSNNTAVSTPSEPITLRLVKHIKRPYLDSQAIQFAGEPTSSIQQKLYFLQLINNTYFNLDVSFNSMLSFPALWISMQLSKTLETLKSSQEVSDKQITALENEIEYLRMISLEYKSKTLVYLRKLILLLMAAQQKDDMKAVFQYYALITMPTLILQICDALTLKSLRFYYVSGSMSILKEFYGKPDEPSPLADFVAKASVMNHTTLFIPNYSMDFLKDFFQILKEFEPFIRSTNDPRLLLHYNNMVKYFVEELLDPYWASSYNPNSVIPYEPFRIYDLQFKFFQIFPSECLTIPSEPSPIHRIFYSFYYSLARGLDNVFPESRYISVFRFIGPSTSYPFTTSHVLSEDLDDSMKFFAVYSLRVLAFFSRRYEFFYKYMIINNPYPEELQHNRFASRKVKVDEVFLNNFRNTALRPCHFPRPSANENRISISLSSLTLDDDQPSLFDTSFSLHLSASSKFSDDLCDSLMDNSVDLNLFDVLESGFLTCDFDPAISDWVEDPLGRTFDQKTVDKFLEDRSILMNQFILKS